MADIALVTADKVNVGTSGPNVQLTVVAAEAITAGAPCYLGLADGKAYNADANAAVDQFCFGIATRTAAAGEAVTLLRMGLMEGWDFADQDYGEPVYVSDTVGRIADAVGTVTIRVGMVVPVFSNLISGTPNKALLVEMFTPPATES